MRKTASVARSGGITPFEISLSSTTTTGTTSTTTTTTTTPAAAAKENDGRGKRRSRLHMLIKAVVAICVSVISYQLLWRYWLAGLVVPEYEIDPETGQKKHRRRPDQLYKLDKFTNEKVPTTPFDGIMEGYLTLVSIELPSEGLLQAGNNAHDADYVGVKGTFCHIAWTLQQKNPASVPMFRDLRERSPLCAGTLVSGLDLYQVAEQARAYDINQHNFTVTKRGKGHQVVPPTAVIFHETRCGSTLVSNLLAASLPKQVRSYSEAPPPLQALLACETLEQQQKQAGGGPKFCDPLAQQRLIRDVFYLMGRVTRRERPQYVFYKIQSIGVRSIDVFTRAMPQVPWAFVYRDPVEILMSHFKHIYGGKKAAKQPQQQQQPQQGINDGEGSITGQRPVCLRNYGKPNQHPLLEEVVRRTTIPGSRSSKNITSLTKEEYCAAHLASLAHAAVTEYQKNVPEDNFHRTSWFFDHRELPHAIWEVWLPRLHMGFISGDMKTRMQAIANVYSKDRNGEGTTQFRDDSQAKRFKAPEIIRRAARLFLEPLTKAMKDIEESQK